MRVCQVPHKMSLYSNKGGRAGPRRVEQTGNRTPVSPRRIQHGGNGPILYRRYGWECRELHHVSVSSTADAHAVMDSKDLLRIPTPNKGIISLRRVLPHFHLLQLVIGRGYSLAAGVFFFR